MAEQVRRAAVLGRPIAHSLSPVLHRAAYAELGLRWRYDAIECGEDELASVLAERPDWAGFSCTMPLKRAVLDVADELSAPVRSVGAANTLLPRPGGGWLADNTDVRGLCAVLAEHGVRPVSAVVLGSGGTAQAAVVALGLTGLTRCAALVRDVGRAGQLRAVADAAGVALEVGVLSADAAALSAELVVSALPPRAADPVAARPWRAGQAVLDVVYQPWPTALATAVSAAGGAVLSGALLLLHQAAAQVELMTHRAAPVEAMRTALRAAAPGCGV
ncbi:MAG: shikimate dehydrogenase [Jatrophihabitantaceae bacterium]